MNYARIVHLCDVKEVTPSKRLIFKSFIYFLFDLVICLHNTMFSNHVAEMALTNVEHILLKENRNKDNKSLGVIQQGLKYIIFPKVLSEKYSKNAWNTLESCY